MPILKISCRVGIAHLTFNSVYLRINKKRQVATIASCPSFLQVYISSFIVLVAQITFQPLVQDSFQYPQVQDAFQQSNCSRKY